MISKYMSKTRQAAEYCMKFNMSESAQQKKRRVKAKKGNMSKYTVERRIDVDKKSI